KQNYYEREIDVILCFKARKTENEVQEYPPKIGKQKQQAKPPEKRNETT
ncbi:29439_t:CDS:1, partial [Gigaspora margarita]